MTFRESMDKSEKVLDKIGSIGLAMKTTEDEKLKELERLENELCDEFDKIFWAFLD